MKTKIWLCIYTIINWFFDIVNGRDKVICTRNLTTGEINSKVQLLRDSSGDKIKNLTKRPVISTTESVRGIWSPFNSHPHTI